MYIYIYIYRERERDIIERERISNRIYMYNLIEYLREYLYLREYIILHLIEYLCIYIYIYSPPAPLGEADVLPVLSGRKTNNNMFNVKYIII